MEEKKEILGETYEPGKPGESYNWREKFKDRKEMLAYLETAQRYWFSKDWFGSEKRKTPA